MCVKVLNCIGSTVFQNIRHLLETWVTVINFRIGHYFKRIIFFRYRMFTFDAVKVVINNLCFGGIKTFGMENTVAVKAFKVGKP